MDKYDNWMISDLQNECKNRGLVSGRVKSELIDRLESDDSKSTDEPMPVKVAPTPTVAQTSPKPDVVDGVFYASFDHVGPPSDDEHDEYKRRTLKRAEAAGLKPRGGPVGVWRKTSVVPGQQTYCVRV